MKKQIVIPLMLLLALVSANGKDIDVFRRTVDYTLGYKWDISQNNWISPRKSVSLYNDLGLTAMTVTTDFTTGDSITRTVNIYDDQQRLIEYYSQNYLGGEWIFVRKYIIERDESGKTIRQIVIDWKNGIEVYNRKQDYFYNDEGRVDYLQYYGWNTSGWYESAKEYYFYNENGSLIRTESYNANGSVNNRVFYESNDYGKRTRILTQGFKNGAWYDASQTLYSYDKCGYATTAIAQVTKNGVWINSSKTEYYWKVPEPSNGKLKVPVCHNGNTIYVSVNALSAHLAHGDCLGECLAETAPKSHLDQNPGSDERQKFLVVYPNPASDRITVRMDKEECTISGIEIADMKGNVLKAVNSGGEKEITLYRGNLKKGNYVMKVYSDKIYSMVIIFE